MFGDMSRLIGSKNVSAFAILNHFIELSSRICTGRVRIKFTLEYQINGAGRGENNRGAGNGSIYQ